MLGITEGELIFAIKTTGTFKNKTIPQPHETHKSKDHRRAEITHNTLWDKVPASAWRNVK
ncbi:TPA: hypothetical protein NN205_004319 [Escherichia coli]|nr:hypothetical protein [Escherichia coli]